MHRLESHPPVAPFSIRSLVTTDLPPAGATHRLELLRHLPCGSVYCLVQAPAKRSGATANARFKPKATRVRAHISIPVCSLQQLKPHPAADGPKRQGLRIALRTELRLPSFFGWCDWVGPITRLDRKKRDARPIVLVPKGAERTDLCHFTSGQPTRTVPPRCPPRRSMATLSRSTAWPHR